MCMFLPILMVSRNADTAHCKAVWTYLVRYIVF